jgi:hypothetical protein
VAIEHRFGETVVEETPTRVATVGLTDHDAVLALGATPVGTTDWHGGHPFGVWPWAQDELGEAEPLLLGDSESIDEEAVIEAGPDVILALYSGLTEQQYDDLSRYAPVIAPPARYDDYGIPWQEQTRIIGDVLGQPAEASELIERTEQLVADAADDRPPFSIEACTDLPVHQEGREVRLATDGALAGGSFISVLSLPVILDQLVPMLAAAVDGDASTEVPTEVWERYLGPRQRIVHASGCTITGMYNPLRDPDDQEPWSITPTPGGPIGPRDHVGHLDEHRRLWAGIAEGQTGVRLTGDRRQGKTSLLNLVGDELARSRDHRVLRVAGETTDPRTFASRLRVAVRSAAWLGGEAERWAVDLDVSAKGIRVRREGGVREGDRRHPLDDDLVVLAARQAAPRRLVVMVDEVTVLLQALQKATDDGGSELLHSLRRARQEGADNLTVVLSGSMGLHHVVSSMQPVNDLRPVRVGRLTPDEAAFLARCLILGAGIDTSDPEALARTMAATTDGGAFYLHHVADQLGRLLRPVTPSDAHDAMGRLLDDPDDPLDFRHYRDRLRPYYGDDSGLAGTVLDAVATAPRSLTTDDVVDAVAAATASRPARELVVSILERLEQDHYLVPTDTGTAFSSELLRRGWIVVRRLER